MNCALDMLHSHIYFKIPSTTKKSGAEKKIINITGVFNTCVEIYTDFKNALDEIISCKLVKSCIVTNPNNKEEKYNSVNYCKLLYLSKLHIH